jgi:hypothetical protein
VTGEPSEAGCGLTLVREENERRDVVVPSKPNACQTESGVLGLPIPSDDGGGHTSGGTPGAQ